MTQLLSTLCIQSRRETPYVIVYIYICIYIYIYKQNVICISIHYHFFSIHIYPSINILGQGFPRVPASPGGGRGWRGVPRAGGRGPKWSQRGSQRGPKGVPRGPKVVPRGFPGPKAAFGGLFDLVYKKRKT